MLREFIFRDETIKFTDAMGQIHPITLITGQSESGKTLLLYKIGMFNPIGVNIVCMQWLVYPHITSQSTFDFIIRTISSNKDCVLLIDNVDLGLSSRHKRELWYRFKEIAKSNNLQFIITSHSSELIEQAAFENARRILEKKEDPLLVVGSVISE